ncbi:MAG: DUF3429 domain-containing protein [Proteobacteria bacterium]|nr:DUF3429 domain-containing protein [Pseudomonadota bacterium]
MLPLVIGAVLAWVLAAGPARLAIVLTLTWGGAILAFLAGVRRGLSFRTPGGARLSQIATMMALFMLAIGGLALPSLVARTVLLAIGFAAIVVLDPLAAQQQEAPPFFARLRPLQIPIAVVSLIAILIRL